MISIVWVGSLFFRIITRLIFLKSSTLKFLDETHGEFKSIRVADKFRGKGAGEKIISHLIDEAKKIGIKKLSVETGTGEFFSSARKLFQKFGFKKCEPFAHYKEDPNSCYFNLEIWNNNFNHE